MLYLYQFGKAKTIREIATYYKDVNNKTAYRKAMNLLIESGEVIETEEGFKPRNKLPEEVKQVLILNVGLVKRLMIQLLKTGNLNLRKQGELSKKIIKNFSVLPDAEKIVNELSEEQKQAIKTLLGLE